MTTLAEIPLNLPLLQCDYAVPNKGALVRLPRSFFPAMY